MNLLTRYLDDAYIAWLSSTLSCCSPHLDYDEKPIRGIEKPMTILHHQPSLVPPPTSEPHTHLRASSREWVSRTRSFASRASSRGSFSVRSKLNTSTELNRPHIGVPTDFRHVQGSMSQRAGGFRPLQLSIYLPDNRLSPILPHLGVETSQITRPTSALLHTRSESALSFHIPRKPLQLSNPRYERLENTDFTTESVCSDFVSHPLRPRPSMPAGRSTAELTVLMQNGPHSTILLRANTEPAHMIERVKSVLQEKEELERQIRDIDSIIEERQSIYMGSYAGSIYAKSEGPMPDLRSSELELLSVTGRPNTAPSPIVHTALRTKSFNDVSSTFSRTMAPFPPPPPLPLILPRPPLRKKKSFSRVSNWLFPDASHTHNISLDSITNTPNPVTSGEGFYRCVDMNVNVSRSSIMTASIVSSLTDGDGATAPTTWTPDMSPLKAPTRRHEIARVPILGEKTALGLRECVTDLGLGGIHRLSTVGVAF